MKKTTKTVLVMMLGMWYVIACIFISTYIRETYIPEAYMGSYWVSVWVYCIGSYLSASYYMVFKDD